MTANSILTAMSLKPLWVALILVLSATLNFRLSCIAAWWSYELMHMADETLHWERRERAAAAAPETPLV